MFAMTGAIQNRIEINNLDTHRHSTSEIAVQLQRVQSPHVLVPGHSTSEIAMV